MVGPSGFQVSGTAPERYEQCLGLIMAPFVEAVISRAGLSPRSSLLDVACGTGFVARAASRIVGPAGRVVGLDVNAAMIDFARSEASGANPSITWVEASALEIPFEDGEFDAVLSQQGVQFFPDLDRAAAEMARVARPGGRVVASFWAPLEMQPYFGPHVRALERLIGDEVAALTRGFSLAPEQATDAWRAAGLHDVHLDEVSAAVGIEKYRTFVYEHIGALPVAPAFAQLKPEQQREFGEEVVNGVKAHEVTEDVLEIPFTSFVVTGAR